jgi:hypothetical protein
MGAFIAFLRQIAGCSRATAPEPKINQRVGKRHHAARAIVYRRSLAGKVERRRAPAPDDRKAAICGFPLDGNRSTIATP